MYFISNIFLYNLKMTIHMFVNVGLSGMVLEDTYFLILTVGGPYEVT